MKIPEVFSQCIETDKYILDLVPDATADRSRLEALTASVLTRFLVRLGKAASAADNRGEWTAWLQSGLAAHRDVLRESIAPLTAEAEAVAGELLGAVANELRDVRPDQAEAVLRKVDVGQWAERIINA